ncbi:MAG: signal peptidase II [Verrucomicrobiota bacterium]
MPTTSITLSKLLLGLSLPLYILDQITKWWIVFRFTEPPVGRDGRIYNATSDSPIVVIENFFNITRVHNQGVAFGFGNGTAWAPLVFPFISLAATIGIIWYWKKGGFNTPLLKTSVGLLFAGIAGNLTDRLLQGFWLERVKDGSFWERLSAGYVVDFLDFTIPLVNYRWPSFNVADSCISVAACLLVISSFRDQPAKAE